MSEQSSAAWDAEAATFDLPADHGLTDPRVRHAWAQLMDRILPPPPAQIADLGCGTGLSLLAAGLGHFVDGVDFLEQMLQIAGSKAGGDPNITFRHCDARSPPLDVESYDVVLVRHVLWTLPDRAAALNTWAHLLRPGSRLVLIEGRWSTGTGMTAGETEGLLREAGLEPVIESLTDANYWGGPSSTSGTLRPPSAVRRPRSAVNVSLTATARPGERSA